MRKSKFTEHQIVSILKEVEAGRKIDDVCRNHGISSAQLPVEEFKYGGMEASDLKRMKALEQENTSSNGCMLIWFWGMPLSIIF